MTRAEIIEEIQRAAAENGGVPLGLARFSQALGVRKDELVGVFWRSWSEALREAGFEANVLNPRIEDSELLEKYAILTRALGHPATAIDIRLERMRDSSFPSDDSFIRRFKTFAALRTRVREWCLESGQFADVASLLPESSSRSTSPERASAKHLALGYVYLIKHGSRAEYKIGKTLNPIRREGELRLQLPERITPIHYIETVDPSGLEAYWHTRFASKRKEGEWFALSAEDVREFKKWRKIA